MSIPFRFSNFYILLLHYYCTTQCWKLLVYITLLILTYLWRQIVSVTRKLSVPVCMCALSIHRIILSTSKKTLIPFIYRLSRRCSINTFEKTTWVVWSTKFLAKGLKTMWRVDDRPLRWTWSIGAWKARTPLRRLSFIVGARYIPYQLDSLLWRHNEPTISSIVDIIPVRGCLTRSRAIIRPVPFDFSYLCICAADVPSPVTKEQLPRKGFSWPSRNTLSLSLSLSSGSRLSETRTCVYEQRSYTYDWK